MERVIVCPICNDENHCFEEIQDEYSSYMCFNCGFMSDSRFTKDNEDKMEQDGTILINKLKRFDEDTPCFVFSDDLDWCKSQDLFKSDKFLFNDNIERYDYQSMDGSGSMQYTLLPHVDLCLMSLCSGAIIVNSSFSWWGAWLQNNRGKVIASKPWFGPSASHLDTSNVVPDHWEIIDWSK